MSILMMMTAMITMMMMVDDNEDDILRRPALRIIYNFLTQKFVFFPSQLKKCGGQMQPQTKF